MFSKSNCLQIAFFEFSSPDDRFYFQVEELTDTYNKDNNDYEKEFVNMAQLLHEKDKQIQTLSEKKQTMVDAAFGLHDEVKELNATIDDLKLNR